MLFDLLFGTGSVAPLQIELRARRRADGGKIQRRWLNGPSEINSVAAQFDADGFDVYFGVALRKVLHQDSGKRDGTKKAYATSAAAWVDLDNPDSLRRIILPPTFVIDSGKNLHLYWLLESPCEQAQELEEVNRALATIPGADKSCTDCVHVLRVPNTHNYKYGAPQPVTVVAERPELKYSPDDLKAMAKVSAKIVDMIVADNFEGDRSRRDWAIVRALVDAGMSDSAIWLIYREWPVGDKTHEVGEQYLQHTIDKARDQGQSEGGFTLRIKGFNDKKEDKSAKTDGAPVAESKKRRKKKAEGDDATADKEVATLPDGIEVYPELRLAEGPDGIYALSRKGDSIELIASFKFQVQGMVQADDTLEGAGQEPDEYVLEVEANGKRWKNVVLPVSAFDDDRKLRKCLNRAAWSYWGNTAQANAIRQMLITKWNAAGKPRKVVVRQLGRQIIKSGGVNYDVFATTDGVYDARTGTPFENLVYMKPPLNLPTVDFDFTPVSGWGPLQQAAEALVNVHTKEVTIPLLGWWIACTFKAPLMENDVHFPHFLLHGTRGSGKSTLLRMFQQLQGIEPSAGDQLSSGTTPFVLSRTLGASMSVPVRLTEFRSDTLRDVHRFNQIMRQLYDGGVDARGRADQSTVSYVYTAPVCLDGEEPFVDAALKERTIMSYLSTDVLETNPEFQKVRQLMPTLPVARLGAQLMMFAAQQDPIELYMQATAIVQEAFNNLPLRIENNVAIILMGLIVYAKFCKAHFGTCLLEPEDSAKVHSYMVNSLSQLVDIETGFSRLPADDFIEAVLNHIASLQSQDEARPDFHYRFEANDGGTVGIHLASAYAWWIKEAQRTHRGQPVERNTIRRMLQNERMLTASERIGKYITGVAQAACNTKVVQRLYMVDPQRAAMAGLDVPTAFVPPTEAFFEVREGKVKLGFGD